MNKTIMAFTVALITVFMISISACKDKENQAPVINLEEPIDNESIAITDSLHIEGTITDDEALHEASIIVTNSIGDTVMADYPYVHDLKTYDVHTHFHPTVAGMFHLHVTAEDHEEKSSTVEKMFTVTP